MEVTIDDFENEDELREYVRERVRFLYWGMLLVESESTEGDTEQPQNKQQFIEQSQQNRNTANHISDTIDEIVDEAIQLQQTNKDNVTLDDLIQDNFDN